MRSPRIFADEAFQRAFERGSSHAADMFLALRRRGDIPHECPLSRDEADSVVKVVLPDDATSQVCHLAGAIFFIGAKLEWRRLSGRQEKRSGVVVVPGAGPRRRMRRMH